MKYAIILGAGKGTRMKSELPKVMHQVCHKPMVAHLVDNLKKANASKVVTVVGYKGEIIQDYLGSSSEFAIQEPQLGTGHAVMQVHQLEDLKGQTIVVNGDCPLISPETFEMMYDALQDNAMVVLTAILPDGESYGRVVVDDELNILDIVEYRDCDDNQVKIKEINTGIYVFNNEDLFENLSKLDQNNSQEEYYITDLVKILNKEGKKVKALRIKDVKEASGINDLLELQEANNWLQNKINNKHLTNGVTIVNSDLTFIAPDVTIGSDSIIYPNTYLLGNTKVASNCVITDSTIIDSSIGPYSNIDRSRITNSKLGEHNNVGPYAHIRNDSVIGNHNRIGNFVELKKVLIENNVKCAHLTYLGDTNVKDNVNIGCGVVTVNYDGVNKFKTVIHEGAFIGSNVNLIAPVVVGKFAVVAAGSTITSDVAEGELAIARNRQVNKTGYGYKYLDKKKEQ